MSSSSEEKEKDREEDSIDTPVPSSKSGKRFEELYRLKGVVSFFFFFSVLKFFLSEHRTMNMMSDK